MKKLAVFYFFLTSFVLTSCTWFALLKPKETFYCKVFIIFGIVFLFYSDIYANTSIYNSTSYSSSVNKKYITQLYADSTISDTLIIEIAKQDAKRNFNNIGENVVVWVINFLLSPLIGWAIPLAILRKPLTEKQIKIPNTGHSDNDIYRKTYINEHNKIRKNRLWVHFSISSGLYFVYAGILIAGLISFINSMW